jgi:hypothetical protein
MPSSCVFSLLRGEPFAGLSRVTHEQGMGKGMGKGQWQQRCQEVNETRVT